MYRQVKVHEDDRKYLKMLWRDDRKQPLKTIELSTVTYGTAAAPFLATRSLNQLALDEQHDFHEASKTVLNNFYVDDALVGANSLNEAQKLQRDLIEEGSSCINGAPMMPRFWRIFLLKIVPRSLILKTTRTARLSKLSAFYGILLMTCSSFA